jgi:hypothetical protein
MPALTIGGIDVGATFGFQFTDEGHALDAMVSVPNEVEIPAMRGAIFVGPNRVPVRKFTFKGFLDGASQATVRSNLHKLQALLGDGTENLVIVGDWPTVQIAAVCVELPGLNYPVGSRANSQNEIPFAVEMAFRASNPYWQDITPQSITFTTTHTAMPQGTAPGEPVLTSPIGVLTTPVITVYDANDVAISSTTLASLSAAQQYRITTKPGVMLIEKSLDSGATWSSSDASMTAGIFPKLLPSNGVAYQTSAWPKLSASAGTWTAAYSRQWR